MDYQLFLKQLMDLFQLLEERSKKGFADFICNEDLKFELSSGVDKSNEHKFVAGIARQLEEFQSYEKGDVREERSSLRRLWCHIVEMKKNADYGTPLYLQLNRIEELLRQREVKLLELAPA